MIPSTTTSSSSRRLYMPDLSSFKTCSFVLGSLVGLFIYLSTLGAEFVGVMLWGKEILNKSNHELVLFSLTWNFATTCVAIIILSSLRRLVASVFLGAMSVPNSGVERNTRHHQYSQENAEDILAELLSYMEGRFAVGALVGICISWNITNLLLGMRPQVMQSCIILAVACLWCRLTLILIGQPEETLIYENLEDEEDTSKTTSKSLDSNDISEPLLQVV